VWVLVGAIAKVAAMKMVDVTVVALDVVVVVIAMGGVKCTSTVGGNGGAGGADGA
jgi:hypothetical protein